MDDLHKMLSAMHGGEGKAQPHKPLDVFREFIARLEELQRKPAPRPLRGKASPPRKRGRGKSG